MELVKDYDYHIYYHPRKGNVVANMLSRIALRNHVVVITAQKEILRDLEKHKIEVVIVNDEVFLAKLTMQQSLIEKIKKVQGNDPSLKKITRKVIQKHIKEVLYNKNII